MVFPDEIEQYADAALPDYEAERTFIVFKIIALVVIFTVLTPLVLASRIRKKENKHDGAVEVPGLPLINVICLVSIVVVIMGSSNNNLTARSAFVAPLLTPEECQSIIDRAHEAARKNAETGLEDENLQKSPAGWRKARHKSYPTTDLNLVTDPFTKEDRAFLSEKLSYRLAPLIERIYGINRAAIRANDMFVVRYDGEEGQAFLRRHTDSSHVSFNILLNEDFEGGGTRFHNRYTEEFNDAHIQQGEVIINNANIWHEGLPTTKGTRYILVGFTAIDTFDPITKESNDLNLFASWLSLPWTQVRFRQGYTAKHSRQETGAEARWTDNKYVNQLFNDIDVAFTMLGDMLSPHELVQIVHPDNATKYIEALDAAGKKFSGKKETWWEGQQLVNDFDGEVVGEWATRKQNKDRFEDL